MATNPDAIWGALAVISIHPVDFKLRWQMSLLLIDVEDVVVKTRLPHTSRSLQIEVGPYKFDSQ
jgi:hypothetical protein